MWYWFMSALQYNSINNHQYVHDLYHPFMVSCWGWFTIAVLVLCNVLNYQPPYFTRNAWWIVYPTLEADAIGITTLTLIQFGHFSVFIHIYIIYIYTIYHNTIAHVDLVRGCQNPRKIILQPPSTTHIWWGTLYHSPLAAPSSAATWLSRRGSGACWAGAKQRWRSDLVSGCLNADWIHWGLI